jgi:Mn-dependent DtxR family transcriptional regulator
MVGCKCIICKLTEMIEHEISKDIYDEIIEHIEHCENCNSLYNTFVKTIDLFQNIEKVKLPKKKKKIFHKWVHIEAQKVVIKRYRY